MKTLLIFSLFITLTSCLRVSFNQPQPKDGNRLEEYPEELRGTWTKDDGDFFTIEANGIESANLIYDSLENLIDTSYRFSGLSDSIRMYQGGNYYIYNEKASKMWIFGVLEVDRKGNIYVYLCDDFKFYAKLKGIKADSATYNIPSYYDENSDDDLDTDTTVYNPTLKELSKIEDGAIRSVYFDGQIRIKDLKKIAIRKNLMSIYWADGRAEDMNEVSEEEADVSED